MISALFKVTCKNKQYIQCSNDPVYYFKQYINSVFTQAKLNTLFYPVILLISNLNKTNP